MSQPSDKAISHLLNKAAADPFKVSTREDLAETEEFLSRFLDQCDRLNFECPSEALTRAVVARSLARKVGNNHMKVRALSLLGTGFRIENCFERAEEIYDLAEELAKGCCCCLPPLYQRRAVLLLLNGEPRRALEYLDRAVQICEKSDDLDGIGRILISRCMSLSELGFHEAAIKDNLRGLQLLAKDTPQNYFIAGLSNMILITSTAVRTTGDIKMIENALAAMASYKEFFQSSRLRNGFRRVRATMRWAEGLLCGSLPNHGYKYRKRAMQALEIAANNFKDMGLMTEYVLVTADRAKLYLTNTRIDNSRQVMTLASRCLRVLEEAGQGGSGNAVVAKALEVMKDLERNPEKELLDGLRESANFYMPSVDPELISVSDAGAVG